MTDADDLEIIDDDEPADEPGSQGDYVKKLNARERDHAESKSFWEAVFASELGRREMWRILQACHTFEPTFACGPNGFPQVEATWFHAGEQAVGMRLYQSWALLDRPGVFAMQDEHDPRFAKPKPPKRKRGA